MFDERGAEDRVTLRAVPVSNSVEIYEEDFTFALAASQSACVLVMVKP